MLTFFIKSSKQRYFLYFQIMAIITRQLNISVSLFAFLAFLILPDLFFQITGCTFILTTLLELISITLHIQKRKTLSIVMLKSIVISQEFVFIQIYANVGCVRTCIDKNSSRTLPREGRRSSQRVVLISPDHQRLYRDYHVLPYEP